MSNEPVVWRTALAGLVAAAVSVGLLTGVQAQRINDVVQVLVPVAAFLLPLIAGILARRKVSPVPALAEHRAEGERLVDRADATAGLDQEPRRRYRRGR